MIITDSSKTVSYWQSADPKNVNRSALNSAYLVKKDSMVIIL